MAVSPHVVLEAVTVPSTHRGHRRSCVRLLYLRVYLPSYEAVVEVVDAREGGVLGEDEA